MQHVNAVALPRIMQCGGSIAMIPERPDTPRDDENGLARFAAMYRLGGGVIQPGVPFMGKVITQEMNWYVEQFCKAVTAHGIHNTTFDLFSPVISTTFAGTPDHFAFDGHTLEINKFVYGWSIVEPVKNWEMILWAILISRHYEAQFVGIQTIRFRVHQVRAYHPKGNIREWSVDSLALELYYDQIVSHFNDLGGLITGPECRHCPASWNLTCPAYRQASFNVLEAIHEIEADPQDPAVIGMQLDLMERAADIVKQRKDALENAAYHALKRGEAVPGRYLTPAQGNRAWKSYVTPDSFKSLTGIEPERSLPTPAKAEQAGVSEAIVAMLSERPNKGMKLAKGDITEKLQ